MPPKKNKRILIEKDEDLESLGIYKDEDEYGDKELDEKEAWRDVG